MSGSGISNTLFDVAVVGAGPAGLAAAIALARSGCRTALVAATPPTAGTGNEARTAALFWPALKLLERTGAWPACQDASAELRGIRIIDRTEAPFGLRAPEVLFEAHEIGLDAFGYNVPNKALSTALRASAACTDGLTIVANETVGGLQWQDGRVVLTLISGATLSARLIAAADGRHSFCREAADIGATIKSTEQTAMTGIIVHDRPHDGISTEFHSPAGPCTVVPLPSAEPGRHASSLVWIERTAVADRLAQLSDPDFLAALSAQLGGLLGQLHSISGRGRFELAFTRAKVLAKNRVMLLAEAAHAMPPIGAQGLNMSLRDVATAVDLVGAAKSQGRDPGGDDVLSQYASQRGTGIGIRMRAVETLNSSLLVDFGPINLARGAGLHALQALPPLKRQLMRLGMGQ